MSKISSCEKFFIGRIALGLENMGEAINQKHIERLLSESLEGDREFMDKIKSALTSAYSKDINDFKKKLVAVDPLPLWYGSVIKLSKGRETLLRDIVIEWYSKYTKPGFWNIIKGLFKKNQS